MRGTVAQGESLASQLEATQRITKTPEKAAVPEEAPARKGGRKWIQPEALIAKRAEFGISQKVMAKLLQASLLSRYKWETGRVNPRAAQRERNREVLHMGKHKALAALARDQ